jgi:hypothetical protein
VSGRAYIVDLYCGLGGWAEGFLAESFDVVGFDIERHDYGTGGYPGQLVIQDVLTLHGRQFKNAAGIVASPPCTEYSYMAMPWKRAKQMARALRGKDSFPPGYKGSRTAAELNALFDACFRIQREASEAAGRHIPLVVENVKGAQPWVRQSQANFGSFYLWGDVGMVGGRVIVLNGVWDAGVWPKRAGKFNPDGTQHPTGSWFAVADSRSRGAKSTGQNWSLYRETGEVSPHWRMEAIKNEGHQNIRDGHSHTRHLTNSAEHKRIEECGVKLQSPGHYLKPGSGADWFDGGAAMYASNSEKRKAASAMIAKIPFPLANYIARQWNGQAQHAGGPR